MNAMKKYSVWKWLILASLVSISLLLVLPGPTATWFREKLRIKGGIRMGLDISGGTSFTLEIDQSKVDKKAIAERILQSKPGISTNQLEAEVANEIAALPKRALEIIRNRVDGLGIAEPVIFLQEGKSGTRIIVQLPGIDAKKRQDAEDALKKAAYLELRLVHEKNEQLIEKLFQDNCPPPPGFTKMATDERKFYIINKKDVRDEERNADFVARLKRFHAPADAEFLLEREVRNGVEQFIPCFVEKKVQLVGSGIKRAWRQRDANFGRYGVELLLNSEAKKKFGMVTGKNIGRQLAIVLDGTLISSPVIQSAITGGQAQITGRFTSDDAAKLATVLQTGSLDAPILIGEKRIVDPTLGKDSVENGVLGGVVGCVAIIILMAAYYLIPGLLADAALILNVLLLPLGMILVAGFLGVLAQDARAGAMIALPVLTLPGIAGIALTIGMAVDANVLIFERMREELRTGKGFAGVVQAGFERAFSAIFDSNITTIITAVILFVLGSGPVRGYAVTLTGGLIVSLFTAVVVTRMCFNLIGTRTE
ncbi:MAG: protein translocase subunit SecD, partial [bacterium]